MLTVKDMTTRELLSAAKGARAYYAGNVDEGDYFIGQRFVKGGDMAICRATFAEIVSELNTRPHLPSKREGKTIRRLRAQTGQSEEWLRSHPKYGQEIVDAQYPNRTPISSEYAARIAPAYGRWFGCMYKIVE
jgi:hypothetical protein